jgi:hypothetical protein
MPESFDHERTQAITALVRFSFPIDELRSLLATFSWDFETPLIVLEPAHIRRSLERYLDRDLTADDVCDWANLIEMRDDVDYQSTELVEDFVFAAANPELEGAIDPEWAIAWSARF